MQITIFTANSIGQAANCSYPNRETVSTPEQLREVVKGDHVCAEYKGNYRGMQDKLEGFLMEYKPHDYQQFAINYILEHPIAAVILGMGLGKTSITLTAIEQLIYDSFEVSKVLVVAPLRVARNTWSDEIHKWNHLKHRPL